MKLQRYDAHEDTYPSPRVCTCDKRPDYVAGHPGVDPATGSRWTFESLPRCDCPEPLGEWDSFVSPRDDGRLVLYADVLAWRDSIREAVAAERVAGDATFNGAPSWVAFRDARAALDALLSLGGRRG